jgi:hypothetical protein
MMTDKYAINVVDLGVRLRKPPCMPQKSDQMQLVIPSVPKVLVRKIDKIAEDAQRSRAAQIRVFLVESVELKERELKPAAA